MKKWMIVATALTALGIVLCLVGLWTINFDFSKLSGGTAVTNTYTPEETFQSITVDTDISDVSFFLSADGKCQVVVRETDTISHTVQAANGMLTVKQQDNRKWYDHIGFYWPELKVEIYLPQSDYENLTISSATGKVEIGRDFSFKTLDVAANTGSVKVSCAVADSLRIKTSTGSITVSDTAPKSADLRCSTGKVALNDLAVSGALDVTTSTGSVTATDCTAQRLHAACDTGKLTLTNIQVTGMLQAQTSTGDITLTGCDADTLRLESNTGDIKGTLLTEKIIFAETDTGKIRVPQSTTGGRCDISTDTGDITITFQ